MVTASSLATTVSITFHKAWRFQDCVLSRGRPGRLDTFSEICWVIQYLTPQQLALAVTKVTPIFDCQDSVSLTRAQLGTSAHHHIHKGDGTKSPGWWQKTVQPYLGFKGDDASLPFHISNRIFLFQPYLGCRGQSDDVQTRLLPLVRKATYAAQHLQAVEWFKSNFDFLVIYIFCHIVDFTGKLKEEVYTY